MSSWYIAFTCIFIQMLWTLLFIVLCSYNLTCFYIEYESEIKIYTILFVLLVCSNTLFFRLLSFLDSAVVILVKNKNSDLSDKNSNRQMALSSTISKIFEIVIFKGVQQLTNWIYLISKNVSILSFTRTYLYILLTITVQKIKSKIELQRC